MRLNSAINGDDRGCEHVLLKKKTCGSYRGLLPTDLYELSGEPIGWECMKPMERIPSKLSNFIEREKIIEVRRWPNQKDQYYIKDQDGKFWELLYYCDGG